MKNLTLLTLFIAWMGFGFTQTQETVQGNFSFELKYAASSNDTGDVVYNPELLFRWKLGAGSRFRLGVWMDQSKEVTQVSKNDFGGINNGYITERSTSYFLKPAFEFSFKTSKTLQPYWALEFPIAYFHNKIENQDVFNQEYDFGAYSQLVSPTLTFGLNAKLGLNALVTNRIYFGAELGLGTVYVWNLPQKLHYNEANYDVNRQTEKFGYFNFGMGMTSAVKVGCLF